MIILTTEAFLKPTSWAILGLSPVSCTEGGALLRGVALEAPSPPPSTREAPSCGAGALEAASPGLVIYTHGCLAILQNKLETELVSLITVFQVSYTEC